ncbi:MAG: ferredoxin domain-containing protein [Methanoregula sp.]|nr:ferredoxin domain-containing protein [Methanoregula sp.]
MAVGSAVTTASVQNLDNRIIFSAGVLENRQIRVA